MPRDLWIARIMTWPLSDSYTLLSILKRTRRKRSEIKGVSRERLVKTSFSRESTLKIYTLGTETNLGPKEENITREFIPSVRMKREISS